MGSWGTAISSNDTYADVYSAFFNLYNEGMEVEAISWKLINDNGSTIDDPEDANNFWFALAKAQWDCKQLNPDVFKRVKGIIESGADIEVWKELDAEPNDIQKREAALNNFLAHLQTERAKPKVIKAKKIYKPVYPKGTCLSFKMPNDNYGGAVVLEANGGEVNTHLMAILRINQPDLPSIDEFSSAEILIANYLNWQDDPRIVWYRPAAKRTYADSIIQVGTLHIARKFEFDDYQKMMSNFQIWVIEDASEQFKSELTKPKPSLNLTLREIIDVQKPSVWQKMKTIFSK